MKPKKNILNGEPFYYLFKSPKINALFLHRKTMPMQIISHSAFLFFTPALEYSSISASSFEILFSQIKSKNATTKRKMKRMDDSSKVISSKEWSATEK